MILSLRDQLFRDEGVLLIAYKDTVGKTTVGVGRNLDDVGISRVEAELMLDTDIARTQLDVLSALPWVNQLDPVRRGVLHNMAFNMGIGGLLQFKRALTSMQIADWDGAARHMLDSKWATQVGKRATRLALQMRTGVWQ
ncbi:MAG TPA: glycoside hydrolase family protein [Candidatus Binatia bacterium]|nr:glycoside hydrolase family protein [Candidatus Binatia bacterium]